MNPIVPTNRSGMRQGESFNSSQQQMQQNTGIPGSANNRAVLDSLRNAITGFSNRNVNASSNYSGGFNWGSNKVMDPAFEEMLKGGTEDNTQSNQYLLELSQQYLLVFNQQIYNRAGRIYEFYNGALDAYCYNPEYNVRCNVRSAFIEDIKRNIEFTKLVAINGTAFFASRFIKQLRANNGENNISADTYRNLIFDSVRDVLSLEIINWLSNSERGRLFSNNLPNDLTSLITRLDSIKANVAEVFALIDAPNPYEKLGIDRSPSVSSFAKFNEMATTYILGNSHNSHADVPVVSDFDRLMIEGINKRAAERNQIIHKEASAALDEKYTAFKLDSIESINAFRDDFENLTTANSNQFGLTRFFKRVPDTDYYLIHEEDWGKLRKYFRKYPSMGLETSVLPGFIRAVNIDLTDLDRGWSSIVIKLGKITMATALTDPALLLPSFSSGSETPYQTYIRRLEETKRNERFEIEVDDVREIEDEIPIVINSEVIESESNSKIATLTKQVAKRLMVNDNGINAVVSKVVAKESFIIESNEDYEMLRERLPFIFSDYKRKENDTYYNLIRTVDRVYQHSGIGEEVRGFITQTLTERLNNWLINKAGYIGEDNHLSVSNLITDMTELAAWLKENDPTAAGYIMSPDPSLMKELVIFEPRVLSEDTTNISEIIKAETTLHLKREMFVATLQNFDSPLFLNETPTYVIKRSTHPEYFSIVEEGFKEIYSGDTIEERPIDKLLYFVDTGDMWLMTVTMLDRNMATLRHVSQTTPLVLLSQD